MTTLPISEALTTAVTAQEPRPQFTTGRAARVRRVERESHPTADSSPTLLHSALPAVDGSIALSSRNEPRAAAYTSAANSLVGETAAVHPPASEVPAGDEPTDAELVINARAGDSGAFEQLVSRYQRRAAWVAYRLLGNRDDALEVSQEAFLRVWNRLGDLQSPEKFGPWLLRTVTNLSLNWRRDHREPVVSLEQPVPGGGHCNFNVSNSRSPSLSETDVARPLSSGSNSPPLATLAAEELNDLARQAIEQLPPKQRTALILFSLEGLPQAEVARLLGTSVEAVKWHVFQARQKLRESLSRYLPPER